MEEMTYAKASERLNEIMRQMEQEQLDVDTLTDTLKEAKELIAFCKKRLQSVDKSIHEIMDTEE